MKDDAAVSRTDCRCEAGGHRGHARHEAAPFERHVFQDDVHRKRQGHPRADALQDGPASQVKHEHYSLSLPRSRWRGASENSLLHHRRINDCRDVCAFAPVASGLRDRPDVAGVTVIGKLVVLAVAGDGDAEFLQVLLRRAGHDAVAGEDPLDLRLPLPAQVRIAVGLQDVAVDVGAAPFATGPLDPVAHGVKDHLADFARIKVGLLSAGILMCVPFGKYTPASPLRSRTQPYFSDVFFKNFLFLATMTCALPFSLLQSILTSNGSFLPSLFEMYTTGSR